MVCLMCDPDGNPCDKCKINDSMGYDYDDGEVSE